MSATLDWPGADAGMRRHGSLLLALALHGGLIAALLHGLPPTPERQTPHEVVIALLSLSSEAGSAAIPPKSRPAPAALAQAAPPSVPAPPLEAPTPLPQFMSPPTAAPAAIVPETPAPVAIAAPASVVSAPPQALRSVAPAPAPTSVPAAAPAARSPVTVSGVEYLSAPKVDYPISARRAGLEGKVLLRLLIDASGIPQRAEVQQSSGHVRLDEAARAATLRAVFKPHVEDGHPMPVYALVPINFFLK